MLLLFIFLRKTVEIIIKSHPYKSHFFIPFLIFFSQSLIGAIIYIYYCKKSSDIRKNKNYYLSPIKIGQIILISNKKYISNDSKFKKVILIIFACCFNFIGSIIRTDDVINFGKKEDNNNLLETRLRAIQIIISSLLCYYTIRKDIYKHQKFSLIFISIFLLILIFLEIFISSNILNKILAMLICTVSCLFRSFLDVTEKYLFDFDYINIFLMLIYEGIIGMVFYTSFFLTNKTYKKEGINLLNDISEFDWNFISFIILILFYIIISGLRNAYRVATNKYYSPMARALFESTLDPLLFLYNFFTFSDKDDYEGYYVYFSIVIISLTVIAFFSLVYNDFIILYCCGLEYNTYSEINKRINKASFQKNDYEDDINDDMNDDNDSLTVIEDKTSGTSIELDNKD